jgi:hypothetical protein
LGYSQKKEVEMRKLLVAVVSCLLCDAAFAWDWNWSVAPTPNLDGGMALFSFTLGPKVHAADPVGAVEADEGFWATIGSHLVSNKGKYAVGASVLTTWLMVAQNNGYWPFKDEDGATAPEGVSTFSTATSVVYVEVSGDNNNVNINSDGSFNETTSSEEEEE